MPVTKDGKVRVKRKEKIEKEDHNTKKHVQGRNTVHKVQSFDIMSSEKCSKLFEIVANMHANAASSGVSDGEALNGPIPSWKFSRRVSLYAVLDDTY